MLRVDLLPIDRCHVVVICFRHELCIEDLHGCVRRLQRNMNSNERAQGPHACIWAPRWDFDLNPHFAALARLDKTAIPFAHYRSIALPAKLETRLHDQSRMLC